MIAQLTQAEPHARRWSRPEYYRLRELGFFDGEKVELIEGEIITQHPNDSTHYATEGPQSRRWTSGEFHRLGELGFFDGQKAELIGGRIVVTSPQNWRHYSTIDKVAETLRKVWKANAWIRTQAPLALGLVVEPEPDISVVQGSREDYQTHPTTAALIVEVSDATLQYDRTQKASLYAAAGILDYWIIDVNQRNLEVHRNPTVDPTASYGSRYIDSRTLGGADMIAPVALPTAPIRVADLLPSG